MKEFDIEKAIAELFATQDCQESINRGIDEKFKMLMPSFIKLTEEELIAHREEVKAKFTPKELIYAYSTEYTNKLFDMQLEFEQKQMEESLYEGLDNLGFSPERLAEIKARLSK